jgi:hypothetical protein
VTKRRRFRNLVLVVLTLGLGASLFTSLPAAAQSETSPVVAQEGSTGEGTTAPASNSTGTVDPAADSVVLEGLGNGHGRGMGQWGAFGYAVDHGWSYRQILDHFYGGSRAGSVPGTSVSVHLTRYDGISPVVHSTEVFTILGVGFAPAQFARVRVVGEGTFSVDKGSSCAGPWTEVLRDVAGAVGPGPTGSNRVVELHPARFNFGNDAGGLLTVCGDERAFRGVLRVVEQGVPALVNVLPVEQYLRGVVPRESPASWGRMPSGQGIDRGIHALQAQAVAARSFAIALGILRRSRGT